MNNDVKLSRLDNESRMLYSQSNRLRNFASLVEISPITQSNRESGEIRPKTENLKRVPARLEIGPPEAVVNKSSRELSQLEIELLLRIFNESPQALDRMLKNIFSENVSWHNTNSLVSKQSSSGLESRSALLADHVNMAEVHPSQYDRPGTLPPSVPPTPHQQLFKRLAGFSLVGSTVMIGGILFLFVLVQFLHVEQHLAYFLQAILSIETNFLLNRSTNWKDRNGNLLAQWIKFHATSVLTFPLNQVLFAFLTWLGLHYLVVMVIGVGVSAVINYIANDRFVFHKSSRPSYKYGRGEGRIRQALPPFPRIGVIIPVRNSGRTIRRCVESVLQQQYPGTFEIFLVGNAPSDDTTWEALGELARHPAIHCIRVDRPYGWTGRDANLKRYCGCKAAVAAHAEVIALLDSQITVPPDWLRLAVTLLHDHQTDGVAGKSSRTRSDHTLASLYQEHSLFSEWPTYGPSFTLSHATIGNARGLPVTNNLFITRQVWEGIQNRWPLQVTYSWEDFRLVHEMVGAGYTLFCTDTLCVTRHHNPKFRLVKHVASGAGAMEFSQDSTDCTYLEKRLLKARIVILSTLLFLGLLIAACVLGEWLWLALLGASSACVWLVLSVISAVKARDIRGLVFPWFDVLHIGAWIFGATYVALAKAPEQKKALAELLVAFR